MRVAVVSVKVPFVRGGAEQLLDTLVAQLRLHDHEAEAVELPFSGSPPYRVLDHMVSARLTYLQDVDRVIALKFPAYYVQHENKVVWLLHQYRQAYDLWGTRFQGLPTSAEGRDIRAAVTAADNRLLAETREIFAISSIVEARLWQYNGIRSRVLPPPLIDPDSLRAGEPQDYILCAGRINAAKRQHLLVDAMRHVRSPVRLIIAGRPDREADARALHRQIERRGLGDRVELIPRWITHEEKVELLAGSLASAYVPFDEDYGYVPLEAMHVQRPVITCLDSGGPLTLVRDGLTGCVVAPEERALAEAIDAMASDRAATARMGRAARDLLDSLNLSWDGVVETLTR